jgi:CheY-like chemotaxis protein
LPTNSNRSPRGSPGPTLSAPPGCVAGDAENGELALTAIADLRPDVVLMDVRMPVMNGLAATGELLSRADPPKVLMLTTFDLDDYVYQAAPGESQRPHWTRRCAWWRPATRCCRCR